MSVLDKFERKISGRKKRLTLFISNGDTDDIMKIVEPLENSGLLTDSATVTVKHEIKKQEGGFFGAMIVSMASALINGFT